MVITLLSVRDRYFAVTAVEAPVFIVVIQFASIIQTGKPVSASNKITIESVPGKPFA